VCGINPVTEPKPMGHAYVGTVVETGSEVRNVKPSDFVVGSFSASDGT
jgi:threonine dehydrogenase-like Zn-dependent dehydrogenase